ncbi:protein FAM78A isoform X3 [Nerophis ophidion]|uniref:protein FAM78A isoform X3 n=1 Tax=Nerophis ophidion TaxID=159077 RepID=UPI002ADFF3D4|nr:protein FAM78A isoform X3 [Nerophis ophidion]
MGCIQSIRCKPKTFRDSIAVLEVNASIDSNPTSIDESSGVVLRYRTPHFRAQARVLVPPVAGKETWTVGWIQACNYMEFYNTYGSKGMSSWELPDLRDGKIQAISDSDGVNYPWYGNTTETCTICHLGCAGLRQQRTSAQRHPPRPELHHLAGGHQPGHLGNRGAADHPLEDAASHPGGPGEASGSKGGSRRAVRPRTAADFRQKRAHPVQRHGQAQRQRCAVAHVAARRRGPCVGHPT